MRSHHKTTVCRRNVPGFFLGASGDTNPCDNRTIPRFFSEKARNRLFILSPFGDGFWPVQSLVTKLEALHTWV
jgi:hypothetical protein